MIYALPDPIFTNDVVGETGLGMEAEEYLNHPNIFRVCGTDQLNILLGNIKPTNNSNRRSNDGEIARN